MELVFHILLQYILLLEGIKKYMTVTGNSLAALQKARHLPSLY